LISAVNGLSKKNSRNNRNIKPNAGSKNNNKTIIQNNQDDNGKEPIISASDIERFGYCPMSWWLKFKGLTVSDEKLKKGTAVHQEIIKEVSKIREKEKYTKTSEFNIKLFAFISIMLAFNAIAILSPYNLIRNFLIYIAVVWIVLALLYFIYHLSSKKMVKTKSVFQDLQTNIIADQKKAGTQKGQAEYRSLFHSSPKTWKRSAIWFLIIAGGLAFNGVSFLQPADEELMSNIYMVSALLWLIGTAAILFIVLRFEELKQKKAKSSEDVSTKKLANKLTESEKLIIGFAAVATLLAVNGLSIQYRNVVEFTLIGQIIMVLAAIWLGASFAFLYLSFKGGIISRGFAKDFREVATESKRYKIMVESITSTSILDRVFKYNWPLVFAIVAIILGFNSILILYATEVMGDQAEIFSRFLIVIALLWLIGASMFLYNVLKNTELANELRRLHGIYKGKIEYTDRMDNRSKMLFSNKYRIRGKPDYIVNIKGKYIPVELKTGKVPRGPHFSHIVQIAAYCLLINDNYKIRPPYGIISYGKDNKHKINFDSNLEELVVEKLDEMRDCIKQNSAHRNHKRQGKCRNCSRRESCPERLND